MQYGISVNCDKIKIVNIEAETDTKPWDVNVLRGYSEGSTDFNFTNNNEATIRIYFLQPGLVINTIEIK